VKDFGLSRSGIPSVFCLLLTFLAVLTVTANAAVGTTPLTISPSNISFGNVPVGTSQAQALVLANSGWFRLTISSATLSGHGFTLSGLNYPVTLDAGQSVTCTITFAPTSAGSDSGGVSISLNTQGNGRQHDYFTHPNSTTVSVPVSGTGVTSGQLTPTLTGLSFGSVQVGGSQTLSETLTNSSGAGVTISAAQVTGSGFGASGLSLPLSLSSGQSVSFSVTFSPTSSGSVSGNVTVTSNASNSRAEREFQCDILPNFQWKCQRERNRYFQRVELDSDSGALWNSGPARPAGGESHEPEPWQCAGRHQSDSDRNLDELWGRESHDLSGDRYRYGFQLYRAGPAAHAGA